MNLIVEKPYKTIFLMALASFLAFKLAQVITIIYKMPGGDYNVHAAKVFFLDKFGYLGTVTNWYDGFQLFASYPPLYYYFNLVFFKVVNHVMLSMVLSIFALLAIGAIAFYVLGKVSKLSASNTILLYLLFYVAPIGNFIFFLWGRVPQLLAWSLFIFFFALILSNLEKPRAWKHVATGILMALIILSHPSIFILCAFIVLGAAIQSKGVNRLLALVSFAASLALTSFWWTVSLSGSSAMDNNIQVIIVKGLEFSSRAILRERILFWLFPLLFLVIYFFILNKKHHLARFYFPIAVLSFLNISLLTALIPILNKPFPFTYAQFYFFLLLFMALKEKTLFVEAFKRIKNSLPRAAFLILQFILLLCFIIVFAAYLPSVTLFQYELDSDVKLLKDIDDRYVFIGQVSEQFGMYAAGAILYDLETPFGWFPEKEPREVAVERRKLFYAVKDGGCSTVIEQMKKVNARYLLAEFDDCKRLAYCEKMEKKSEEFVSCLYQTLE